MKTTTDTMRRRSFFAFLLGGGTVAFALGEVVRRFTGHSTAGKNSKSITVTINPLAVPRTKTDPRSHE